MTIFPVLNQVPAKPDLIRSLFEIQKTPNYTFDQQKSLEQDEYRYKRNSKETYPSY